MRVVSLVPSLTETLIEAGANVVGRTRFCVHPEDKIALIPAVGGTKDLSWEKLKPLHPDLLILDQEENLPWMKAEAPCAVHVFHATSVADMPRQMQTLAGLFEAPVQLRLLEQARLWTQASVAPDLEWRFDDIPAELRREVRSARRFEHVLYLIWKNPWMGVSQDTFIGSMFAKLGATALWPEFSEKYPKLDLAAHPPETTLLLLSSEPFPFGEKWDQLPELAPYARVLVDGESFSWFGVRSLRFLLSRQANSSRRG
ncbi:MAG: helical backbone metal receptor [Actinobacteria bacterium]|nr:helical backbone metal receptor [Actinomycetota bacterium]